MELTCPCISAFLSSSVGSSLYKFKIEDKRVVIHGHMNGKRTSWPGHTRQFYPYDPQQQMISVAMS
jgi:hypothetical protein